RHPHEPPGAPRRPRRHRSRSPRQQKAANLYCHDPALWDLGGACAHPAAGRLARRSDPALGLENLDHAREAARHPDPPGGYPGVLLIMSTFHWITTASEAGPAWVDVTVGAVLFTISLVALIAPVGMIVYLATRLRAR